MLTHLCCSSWRQQNACTETERLVLVSIAFKNRGVLFRVSSWGKGTQAPELNWVQV